jgi:hypothetical protein
MKWRPYGWGYPRFCGESTDLINKKNRDDGEGGGVKMLQKFVASFMDYPFTEYDC